MPGVVLRSGWGVASGKDPGSSITNWVNAPNPPWSLPGSFPSSAWSEYWPWWAPAPKQGIDSIQSVHYSNHCSLKFRCGVRGAQRSWETAPHQIAFFCVRICIINVGSIHIEVSNLVRTEELSRLTVYCMAYIEGETCFKGVSKWSSQIDICLHMQEMFAAISRTTKSEFTFRLGAAAGGGGQKHGSCPGGWPVPLQSFPCK